MIERLHRQTAVSLYIIDLGPEGGDAGGTIVAQGTPEEVAAVEDSYTGLFLAPYLRERSASP